MKVKQITIPVTVSIPEIIKNKDTKEGILLKISDDRFNNNHPNGFNTGYSIAGFYQKKPLKNSIFEIENDNEWFKTTLITEIIEENNDQIKFKSMNSTFLLKLIN